MQSEKQIEAAARADAEYAGRTFDALSSSDKTRFRERAKLMLEAALSTDAEPVKTAPAVAVKALQWRDEPVPPSGETLAPSVVGLYCIPHSGDRFYLRFRDAITLGDYSTLDKAKAAAQADYEARVLSALSAQVQDVADLPQDVIDLVITAREFWGDRNDMSAESDALDKALEKFASRVPYEEDLESPASKHGDAE